MSRSKFLPAVLFLMCFILAGCLEIEEKVALLPTGEGTIRFLIRLPIAGKGELKPKEDPAQVVRELSKELAGFTSVDLQTKTTLGQTVIELSAKAPTLAALGPFYGPLAKSKEGEKPAKGLGMLSPKSFYTMKRKGDRLLIARTLTPPKQKKLSKDEQELGAFVGAMSGFMRFELDVPGKVISSNAEEVSGQRLTWVIPIDYLQKNKVQLRAEVAPPPEVLQALGK
jgi:hypothetical protein